MWGLTFWKHRHRSVLRSMLIGWRTGTYWWFYSCVAGRNFVTSVQAGGVGDTETIEKKKEKIREKFDAPPVKIGTQRAGGGGGG